MRKLLFIVAILFFVLGTTNCKRTTLATQAEPANRLDSILDGLQLNKKTFSAIIHQLNLNSNECYWPFVSEQIIPDNQQLAIWVIPMVTQMGEDESDFHLAGYIILADVETGEIKSKYYQKDAWVSHTLRDDSWESNAYQLIDIAIDTLSYQLNDGKVILGVRSSYDASLQSRPIGHESLQLFVQQGGALLPIFKYNSKEHYGETDGTFELNGKFEEHETELVVTKQSCNGFYNFALLTNSRWDNKKKDKEVERTYSLGDSIRLFSYNGKEYKEVIENATTVVYKEQIGESWKRDWFYYGKTLVQAYTLLWEERNGKSHSEGSHNYLKKEIPQENLEYKVPVSEEETFIVKYTHDGEKCLIVDRESELGSEHIVITEKKNYTQISSWITD